MKHTTVMRKLKKDCIHLWQMRWNCTSARVYCIKVLGESQKPDDFQNSP